MKLHKDKIFHIIVSLSKYTYTIAITKPGLFNDNFE